MGDGLAARPTPRTGPTLAVFVSKTDHVLQELIYRVRAGDLRAEIACVVSNHRDLEPVAGAPASRSTTCR